LNNPDFLGSVALAETGSTWESVGQVVRAAVENIKAQDGVPGAAAVEMPKPKTVDFNDDDADLTLSNEDEDEEVSEPEPEPAKPMSRPASRQSTGLQSRDVPQPPQYDSKEESEEADDFEEW